ncbi:MAG: hypothetical protein UX08_C0010G0007 [Candidatus Collierbacteria bacterium GW2011_GWB1_45_35]|uniref:Uncharacterized protein n=2 Tax=Candidatus Collieribacteriota TaxID=1752725 RepID=A0A0G1N0T9_9BACT|nr:MAG: hypothetical protein UW48_C0007G0006 [Microgenomates group bacterium GW2011_GWC1_44_23]KKT86657.1 MAG: hypothetical protein UW84_C0005G0006 [Candidatus Collierbacteria bacterium GW2011_GWA2_44_99]KKT95387.1 MAG: hypothetical protein UW96_C0007G0016 [Candidatus Collierbacteria bacterium GW2011_GWA1_45_15]KKU00037.1 MAG: hypothetical protein UX01_C0007G0016 [Candidatus Collierbacteria bacterium GW2011_GWB2_45_17]KKU05136.1 MAG: hypothetical protein UX08_C0010G0007 [Candidatus Collierbacte
MNLEYDRRIKLCANAVEKATKKLRLGWGFAEDYQGIEIKVDTEVGYGMVIVLMDTGHGPRFPKFITLTVHGYVDYGVNKNVRIGGGGLLRSRNKFLPDQISEKWLKIAISNSAKAVQAICTAANMAKLKKEALAKRRLEIKSSQLARHKQTILNVTSLSK